MNESELAKIEERAEHWEVMGKIDGEAAPVGMAVTLREADYEALRAAARLADKYKAVADAVSRSRTAWSTANAYSGSDGVRMDELWLDVEYADAGVDAALKEVTE